MRGETAASPLNSQKSGRERRFQPYPENGIKEESESRTGQQGPDDPPAAEDKDRPAKEQKSGHSIAWEATLCNSFREALKKSLLLGKYRRASLIIFAFQPLVESSERPRSAPSSLRLSEMDQLIR